MFWPHWIALAVLWRRARETPEVIKASRETPENYLTGLKGCSFRKVTWLTTQLRSCYTNAHSTGNKQGELKGTVLMGSCDLAASLKPGGMNPVTGM